MRVCVCVEHIYLSIYLSIYICRRSTHTKDAMERPVVCHKGDRQQVVERQQVVVYECNKSLDNRNKKRHESQQER